MDRIDTQEFQARLEEYKDLRAEARGYLTGGHYNRNFAFIITLGVFGAAAALPQSCALFFVAAILVGLLWQSDIDKLRAIFRLSTYIELVIEPKIPSLQWETLIGPNQSIRRSFWRAISGRGDFIMLYVLHASFAMYLLPRRSIVLLVLCALILVTFLIWLMYQTHAVWATGRRREKEAWEKTLASEKQN